MPNAPVHFEIPADDVARAIAFYSKTFGWKIKSYPMPAGAPAYYSVSTTKKGEPGIGGGLSARGPQGTPFLNYLGVKSVDASLAAVQANGGMVLQPKMALPGNMGWIAVFKDPENNLMGLYQGPPAPPKPRAKARRAPARKAAVRRAAAKPGAKKAAAKKTVGKKAVKVSARKGGKKTAKRR